MKKVLMLLILAVLIVLAIRLTSTDEVEATGSGTEDSEAQVSAMDQEGAQADTLKDYSQFLDEKADAPKGKEDIAIPFDKLKTSQGDYSIDGNAISVAEDGFVDVAVDVPEPGLYELEFNYMPVLGRSAPVEIAVQVNHEISYRQAANILLERIWQDKSPVFETDSNGNDTLPTQIEKGVWSTKRLMDSTGFNVQPLLFYLDKGENLITVTDNREAVLIRGITVCAPLDIPDYGDYIGGFADKKPATQSAARIQAENTAWKSDLTLLPGSDRTSPLTEPYKGSKISLNMFGGNAWCLAGETAAWTFNAPRDALYEIRFKVKQDFIRGTYSGRTLKIDGEIPFKEAENIKFIYDGKWQTVTLGDGEKPYYVYLSKGEHELSMEVTLGDLAPYIQEVDACAKDINGIYRKFLMIMGYTPDIMRDYKLDRQLPGEFALMAGVADRLDSVVNEMSKITGTRGTELLPLSGMSMTLRDFVEKPYDIPAKFNVFISGMSALDEWRNDATVRPLEIDYIDIAAPGTPLPQINPTFLQNVGHSLDMFLASFTQNYNSLGSTAESNRKITVWSTTGRDQAQVLNQLIKTNFGDQAGINVEIQLVIPDIILPSTAAGNGPDVILNGDQNLPVNYAIRGAAVDLSKFDGFDKTAEDFRESAMIPARFNGGVYGLPEMETFPMLFYRKDVLDELNIDIPNTWDDVLNIIPALQRNNMSLLMDTGIANTLDPNFAGGTDTNTALDMYAMLLYQRGGKIYEGDGIRSRLDGELAIETFKDWCKFYTNYGLPTNFNAAYRFRTGESPLIIANLSLYNTLMVSAPEIKGMWGMEPVPGTDDGSGNIDRTVKTRTTYTVMTKTSKNKEAAWEFIKWWLSPDIQESYGRNLESVMGSGARYMTANTVAFNKLPWATKDLQAIEEQDKWTTGVPEVAGGYFLSRHINNAFRSVVIDKTEPRETLIEYAGVINEELTEKRREFGLPVYQK